MLSTFILPVARFDQIGAYEASFRQDRPLQISALGPKTANDEEFLRELKKVVEAIRLLRSSDWLPLQQLEMPFPGKLEAGSVKAAATLLQDLDVRSFWEAPPAAAERVTALLAPYRDQFGFKLRTGGITSDAFPTSTEIAEIFVLTQRQDLPLKFTAGLHHPVRMYREEVRGKMHGFLNVLGAGVLAKKHGWSVDRIASMLDDEDASSFRCDDEFFAWRDDRISTNEIAVARERVTSFGSCSFDEPRADLRQLQLL